MAFPYDPTTIVNSIAFVGLTIATYTVFYFGRILNPTKGIGINLFTLALGINLIGLSHLFRIFSDLTTSPLVLLTISIGAVFLTIGVILVFHEKATTISILRRREEEIKSVIAKLKDKYYQQELSEEELKSAYVGLLRELAEIEVKIAPKESKK